MMSRNGNSFQSVIDQVFPYYVGVFADMYCHTSLVLIQGFTTPGTVVESDVEYVSTRILDLTLRSKSLKWAEEKARLMLAAAKKCPQKPVFESHMFAVCMLVDLMLQYQEHLSCLQQQIDTVADNDTMLTEKSGVPSGTPFLCHLFLTVIIIL